MQGLCSHEGIHSLTVAWMDKQSPNSCSTPASWTPWEDSSYTLVW